MAENHPPVLQEVGRMGFITTQLGSVAILVAVLAFARGKRRTTTAVILVLNSLLRSNLS